MNQLMQIKFKNKKRKLNQWVVQLEQRYQLLAQQREQFHIGRDRDREIMSMVLCKIADVRKRVFFEMKKKKIVNRNSSDFQFGSSAQSGRARYGGPLRYQYDTGDYGNDLPDFLYCYCIFLV